MQVIRQIIYMQLPIKWKEEDYKKQMETLKGVLNALSNDTQIFGSTVD